jgi:hypothetical protein
MKHTEYKEHDMPQPNDRIADRSKHVGGNHYNKYAIPPWDVIIEYKLDYFEGNALKYLLRRKSNRVEDLEKAAHYPAQAIYNEKQKIGDHETHTRNP